MKWIWPLLLSLYLFNTGCIKSSDINFKNLKVDDWKPDWALPILNSSLTLKSLVKTSDVLTIDQNGMYTLHYNGQLLSVKAADYIKIPDQAFHTPSFTLAIPITSPSYSGTVSDVYSGHFSYADANGAQLSHINIKSGNAHLIISNTFNQDLSLTITFPNISRNGSPFSINTTISYPATTSDISADLSGCAIDLTNGGTTNNYIAYTINYTLKGSGQPVSPSDNILASVSMSSIAYSFIDGFLGHYTIPIPSDTIKMNVFNDNIIANIFLRNPSLRLTFANSFGLGISTQLTDIYSITNKNVAVNFIAPTLNILGAASSGARTTTNYTIDSSNSSIQSIFTTGPNKLAYQGSLTINPGTGTGYNFISDTSTVTLNVEAELPACFKINQLSVGDTVALVLPQDTSLVQHAEFKLLMDNGFPLYGSIQLYFVDSNYAILDSLIMPNGSVLQQAPVDASGVVTGHTQAITTFEMEHGKYNAMAPKVRHAFIRSNLYSSGTNTVQIRDANYLLIKLAFRFTLDVPQGNL